MRPGWTLWVAVGLFLLFTGVNARSWGGKDEWLQKALAAAFPPPRGVLAQRAEGELLPGMPLRLQEDLPFRITIDKHVVLQEGMGWLSPVEDSMSIGEGEKQEVIPHSAPPIFSSSNPTFFVPSKVSMFSPQVAIYTTHNAEAYIPTDGQAKREGENASIAEVAQYLGDLLEKKYGIPVVVDHTIHDYPDWNKSYTQSRRTVVKLLQEYPDLKLLLDIHRDSLPNSDSQVVTVEGEKSARILFVVGSYQHQKGNSNASQPNSTLARQLSKFLDEGFPGLCRGVRIKPGTYNQDLHPGALLIEIGNTHNSLEESKKAAEALAEVLARWLKAEQST